MYKSDIPNEVMRLLAAFILTTLLVGCSGKNARKMDVQVSNLEISCIERIIEKDSLLGRIRNTASDSLPLSKVISHYTHELKSLDYSNCPEAFRSAFLDHISAWVALKKVTDKYPELRGELHEIFEILGESEDSVAFKHYEKQIWDTWRKVEQHVQ